ncbi:MAG: DEAD/DEAH box helicase [Candidatus Eisenbacteria bacterium]|uniref:DEAD/DEAH box helicase n=1 Tax=Eiseniibacteriota bacterium TaxID=2212470 RepID=A0A7Y2E723_UNCEI|nr:DEAD/DEAH box helicase [Candidatus Eisenbacteria bacterium]
MSTAEETIQSVLETLKHDPSYQNQLCHVEHIPAREAQHRDVLPPLSQGLCETLSRYGVNQLYRHQAETISHARAKKNVVTVTGTASGKTLAYLLPILETLEQDSGATALLLYPTKALTQDQLKAMGRLLAHHPSLSQSVLAGSYDGDTSGSARRKIRDEANLLLTNPDMLHRGILPYHAKWHRLFKNLRYVVIDEVHSYRGIFGSNVGQVLRRLQRIQQHYAPSAKPVFLASSATIQNPKQHAEALVGAPFELVDQDGAPRGPKTFCFWNPPYLDRAQMERKSGNVEAKDILVQLMQRGIASIVFTKARVVAELIYRYARGTLLELPGLTNTNLSERLTPYRGGYLPSDRREIERRLFSGELLGVISTNALELGIDIGSLDASITVGFPGTIASLWQQAGRAGRTHTAALTLFIAYNDPIDQYLVRHPQYFFEQTPESAVIDTENPYILASHLSCAAFELPLRSQESELFGETYPELIALMKDVEDVVEVDGKTFWSSPEFPAQSVSLRTISDNTYSIVDVDEKNKVIGTVDAISALELVYPEAIYLHRGETFFVQELDLDKKLARVQKIEADYYTQPVLDASIKENNLKEQQASGTETVRLIDATVTWATTMLKKLQFGSMDSIGYKNLDLPPQHLETVALAWTPSPKAVSEVFPLGVKVSDALSGVRNLAITIFPLLAMCDRADVGGIVNASNTGKPTLYLYDRFPGGLGFSERAYENFTDLLQACLKLVSTCPCEAGCPSCVGLATLRPPIHQDPDALGGYPIPDKHAATVLLRGALRGPVKSEEFSSFASRNGSP